MGGLLGGGGGGGSGSGASNPFAGAGGGFTGAATDLYPSDPNAYDYSGGGQGGAPNAYAYSGQTLGDASTMDPGNAQSAQTAPQQIQAGSTPAPPDQTPAGQQSGSSQPSLLEDVSNVLLGKGTSDVVGANQAQATGGGGGPPAPTQSFGWTMPTAQQGPQQGPSQTNLTGTTFFDSRQTQRPSPATPATPPATPTTPPATPGPATAAPAQPPAAPAANTPDQLPLPPMPFPTEGTQTADATVPPQSSTATSGNKTETSTPDATAPDATTPPATTGPDLMGSSRESGMGPTTPGYYDPRTGGAQGVQQGIGSKGNALGDLLTLNFGRFFGDLLGGGGQPGGQPGSPYASSQPPDTGGATTGTSPAPSTSSAPTTAQAGVPDMERAGPLGLGSPNRFGMYQTSTGLPQETEGPGASGTLGIPPGQPQVSRADMGFLPGTEGRSFAATAPSEPTQTAAAPQAPAAQPKQSGQAAAAIPPGAPTGQPVGTSGTMTVGAPGAAGWKPRPLVGTPQAALTPGTPDEAQHAAKAAETGKPSASGIPAKILAGARDAAAQGGPRAVDAWMRQNGHPRDGNWCAEFASAVMHEAGVGLPSGNANVASNWRNWGSASNTPVPGGVIVRKGSWQNGRYVPTGNTGSHVAVVESVDAQGNIHTIGGNQGNIRGVIPRSQWQAWDFRAPPQDGVQNPVAAARTPRWANALPGPGGTVSAGPATRGDRNMNPGNIKMGPDARQYGATGVDNQGHAIFPSVEAGVQAQASLLRRNYNNKTVPEMWDNGRGYATGRDWPKDVMRAGGFGPNERLNLNDPATLDRLQHAIWRAEGTHPNVGPTASAQSPIRLASSSNEISPDVARMVEQRNQEMESDRRRNAGLAKRPTIEEGSPSTGSHVPSNRRFHPSDIDEFIQKNAGSLINAIPASRVLSILRSAINPTTVGRDENVR